MVMEGRRKGVVGSICGSTLSRLHTYKSLVQAFRLLYLIFKY